MFLVVGCRFKSLQAQPSVLNVRTRTVKRSWRTSHPPPPWPLGIEPVMFLLWHNSTNHSPTVRPVQWTRQRQMFDLRWRASEETVRESFQPHWLVGSPSLSSASGAPCCSSQSLRMWWQEVALWLQPSSLPSLWPRLLQWPLRKTRKSDLRR